jgi:hypothetical protein
MQLLSIDKTKVLPNVRGYAFSGSARVIRVDVSGDGGQVNNCQRFIV